jgi:4-hydroxy-tetrahydrodipicolinate synthase
MQLEGIYPVVPTPFENDGDVDHESIERLAAFMIDKGVNGLAVLGALGEGHKLDQNERNQVIRRFKSNLPKGFGLVVGVRSAATGLALRMAQAAQASGADAILLGPLPLQSDTALFTYYQRVSAAVDVPVMIHDYPAATGIVMSPDLIGRLFNENNNIAYIKLEDPPTGPKMEEIRKQTGGEVKIFGALGGMYAFEELDRGAVGIMTGFAFPELLVELYRRYRSQDIDGAATIFYDMLPLNRLEFQPGIGVSIRKQVLVKRGVFKTAHVRHPGQDADPKTMEHIFRIVDHLKERGYLLSSRKP